jgi:hypothetical protein
MSWVRNFLIAIGAFWLSHEPVALVAWPFMLANNGVIYGDSIISAIANGLVSGMGRAVCAGLGATVVTLSAAGEKPQRWASIVAVLYVFAARPHYHWTGSSTKWLLISQGVDVLWPAIVCLAVATIVGKKKLGHPNAGKSDGARSVLSSIGRRIKKYGIVKSLWVLSSVAALAVEFIRYSDLRGVSDDQFVVAAFMFVLSFPSGILVMVTNYFCSNAGCLPPGRMGMVFFWSFFFVAGYVQWFVLIPALRARTKLRRSG